MAGWFEGFTSLTVFQLYQDNETVLVLWVIEHHLGSPNISPPARFVPVIQSELLGHVDASKTILVRQVIKVLEGITLQVP